MVQKCCYVMPLTTGSLMLGVVTLLLSIVIGIYSVVLLALEDAAPGRASSHLMLTMHLEFDSKAVKIILSIVVLVELLWMTFSILLIIGIKKNHPSFLLGYFSFGIVMAILIMLSGLLVLLKQHWILSAVQFIAAAIYIHGLIVVYHGYEEMQTGYQRWGDEDQLWNPDEEVEFRPTEESAPSEQAM